MTTLSRPEPSVDDHRAAAPRDGRVRDALAPAKLLVVDDHPENLVAIEAVLRSDDVELVSLRSGQEALRFLLHDECALILLDVHMPGMDGFETARLIRSNARTRAIPIVFMSAVDRDARFVAQGYGSGAIDYLLKPVDPDVLRAKVAAFVELYRAKQEVLRQAALLREHEQRERRRIVAEIEIRNLRRERAAQERYRRLLDGITHAFVWTLDPATLSCSFVSSSAEAILGRPADAWTAGPRAWLELFPEAERGEVEAQLAGLAAGGERVALQHRLLRADGRVAWFETEVRRVPAEQEGAIELRAFSVDVTEQRTAEQVLAFLDRAGTVLASSLELDEALRSAAEVPVPYLADFCLVRAAQGPESGPLVAGAPAGAEAEALRALADDPAMPRAPAGGHAAVVEDVRPLLGAEGTAAADRLGAKGPLAAVAVALEGREGGFGELVLLRAAGRGFGARERWLAEEIGRRASQAVEHGVLYRRAREAVAAREEFISIASHELRTPLTPLSLQLGQLHRAVSALPDGPGRAGALQRVSSCARQVERVTRLVSNLLDLTRLRAGQLELERERFDLAELVEEIAARTRDELARSGRAVELIAEEPIVGRWDRLRVDQVISNIAANAARYGGDGPVRLRVRRDGDAAMVAVSDEGIGIAPEDLARVFDRYEKGANARGRGGLGLGLYITRRIVEAHGGRVVVESAVGKGSTFTVVLPLADAAAGVDAGTDAAEPAAR